MWGHCVTHSFGLKNYYFYFFSQEINGDDDDDTFSFFEDTVESRFNDMPRGRQNYIVKPGYRYTEIPGITIFWENF